MVVLPSVMEVVGAVMIEAPLKEEAASKTSMTCLAAGCLKTCGLKSEHWQDRIASLMARGKQCRT